MNSKGKFALIAALLVLLVLSLGWLWLHHHAVPFDPQLEARLDSITQDYRRIIVLMDGAADLDAAVRTRCRSVGKRFFFEKQSAVEGVTQSLTAQPQKIRQFINYVTSPKLRDADRLAFLDIADELSTLPNPPSGVKAELDDLHSIQNTYREEVSRIFSQFATRGGNAVREKWSVYVNWLRTFENRDKLLEQFDDGTSDEPEAETRGQANPNEVSGKNFEPKTVALTFDDGPHPHYTEEVTALLRKYGIRAAFFEIGKNLGKVNKDGTVTLLPTAEISKRLLDAGHVVANHTYSHRVMVKLSEADRTREIETTSLLLEKALGQKPQLFRPPYGARNKKVLEQINGEGLENVMWTIDSEDWADPIPESIAMRVLHELDESHKGIILFHDIHKQGVLALPLVLDELQRQNYTFLAFDGTNKLVKSEPPIGSDRAGDSAPVPQPVQTVAGEKFNPYRQSWAVIIGINEYQSWPKLRYAVNDANAVEQTLVNKFGFKHENIFKLTDGQATREHIMQVMGDELTNPAKVSHDDRIFFFFAGHGATRTMSDNRQTGFIIPVDADKTNYYATAVSMSELREAADLIPAKHVYFVMDSCYSGLALTRGGGSSFTASSTYLDEVTSRVARQILTAGGANQEVADDGPNGHSVFTWALLEGLDGKADLDHNGVITASELGAYVSPVVASFSHQTPVMGNLIGSEGGEFIFELQPEALTSSTQQFEGKSLALNEQLASLDKQIAAKQEELLKLQQSIQTETEKLAQEQGKPQAAPVAEPPKARAYDLDRTARGLYREKKYDDAAKLLEQAVTLKPNDPVLLNNLGFVYFQMGRYNDAVSYLEKTLALDPARKEAHGNLAYAYLKLGRRPDAKTQFEKYLELYPNSPTAPEVRQILATL